MPSTNSVLSRLHRGYPSERDQSRLEQARRLARVSGPGPLWGAILGVVLLPWCVLMVLAPELGSLVAIFGSPVLALFVIVRLLTPESDQRMRIDEIERRR